MPRCGVCLDDCGEKNISITECGHKTHIECLIRVLSTSDNCIYCRKKLNLQCKELQQPLPHEVQQFNSYINEVITRQIGRSNNEYEDEDEHERENVWEKCYKLYMNVIQVCIGICLIAIIILFV